MEEILRPGLMLAVFALMFAVGMDCSGGGLRRCAARPGLIASVTFAQYVCIPGLILIAIFALQLPPLLASALILIGSCPSGTISNAYTFLARGNTDLSVSLTALSNLAAFIATPLALSVAGNLAGGEIAESLILPPGPLARQLLVSMLLPLGLGIACRARFPELVSSRLNAIRGFCFLLILSVVGLTVLADPAEIGTQLVALAVPVLVITPALFLIALLLARAFGANLGDRRAMLFELPCRNVALAMLIALSVMDRPDLAFVAMAFFILESVLLLVLATLLARPTAREIQIESAADDGGER